MLYYIYFQKKPKIEKNFLIFSLIVSNDLKIIDFNQPLRLNVILNNSDNNKYKLTINYKQNDLVRINLKDLNVKINQSFYLLIFYSNQFLINLCNQSNLLSNTPLVLPLTSTLIKYNDNFYYNDYYQRSFKFNNDSQNAHLLEYNFNDLDKKIWDSSIVLSHFLNYNYANESNTSRFVKLLKNSKRPLNILELGSGIGLLSINLSQLLNQNLNHSINLTDFNSALELIQLNLNRNKSLFKKNINFNKFELVWGDLNNKSHFNHYDLLIGADITYNSSSFKDLFKTLECLFNQNRNLIFLLGYKFRHEDELDFFDLCKTKLNLNCNLLYSTGNKSNHDYFEIWEFCKSIIE